MSYNISSESFSNPLLKELLEELTKYFSSIGTEFYVIGATARDIILSNIHNQQPERMTSDLDIAIAIPDWEKYSEIAIGLCQLGWFQKSEEQKQRFSYKGYYQLDIVPFGEIAKVDNIIYWPPEENQGLSVAGYTEIVKNAITIIVDDNLTIYVADVPGIFLLKLAAWRDRHFKNNNDAYDIYFIISVYLDINIERVVAEHYDIYESDNFSPFIAGATLLGRDVKEVLKTNTAILNEFKGFLQNEVAMEEGSFLINQIMEIRSLLKYEEVYNGLLSITNELSK